MMRRERPVPLRSSPRVSVVIPCYNYGQFLPVAVASALDQRDLDVEVLVVDDASTDDSAAVARRLAAGDPRVDVLLHETNCGHIRTYNDGLAKVDGDYVVLLSADDALTTDSLTRSVALLEAHPRVGLVYGRVETFGPGQSVPQPGDAEPFWSLWTGRDWLHRSARRGRNIITNPEVVMRSSLLRDLGNEYDSKHPHAADMLLWLRAAARADIGRVNGPVQGAYRVHGANMHLTRFAGAISDLRHVAEAFDAFFAEETAVAPGRTPEGWSRLARRAVAREAMLVAAMARVEGEDPRPAMALAAECGPALRAVGLRPPLERRVDRAPGPVEKARIRGTHRVRWAVRSRRNKRWGT